MRLIDANALETHEIYEGDFVRVVYADDIDEAQTIDAVPVVRCKDCKYYNPIGVCIEMNCSVCEDSFCCWAERRLNEHGQ